MWMSDAFAEMMLGHLVCLVQGNAFILVEWAYLGRGKLRWPVLWAELLCMGQLGLSLATGMSFFNVQSVLLNVLYLFVTAQLFGGTMTDKLTACLINGTMCLLVENTVNYTYSWFTGVRTGEAWQHPGCLIALCAANLIVGAAVAHSLYSWNQKCALQPLQALVMSFFPGVAVVLNIVLMVTGTQQPATRMTMLLTFGMSVAVLVHIAIVQMFNDQVVQRQNSRYRAQLEQQRAEALLDSYTEQRRLTHEFTNHMTALTALLDQGDLKGAQAYIASVSKTVAAGTTLSYGRIFTAPHKMRVGTVSIGYADGFERNLSGKAKVLIRGKFAPVIGRVCMDQLMVDLTDIPDAQELDLVTVVGQDGENAISFDDFAALSDTVNYEKICLVGKRVPRVYRKGGMDIGVAEYLKKDFDL